MPDFHHDAPFNIPAITIDNLSLHYKLRRPLRLLPWRKKKSADEMDQAHTYTPRQIAHLHHDHIQALRNISFSLRSGDRLAIVGSNGSGKSTLLKVIAGIYAPTSGSIQTHGRLDALLNIRLGFRPHATGRRNIILRGLIHGWSMTEIDQRMAQIIAFSELEEFIDLPFQLYSQGMAARLAFAAATSFDPEILLLDEWIGAGDVQFQRKASVRMKELVGRAGILVLASHNTELLRRTCNKALHLEKGELKIFDDIDTVLSTLPS